MIEEIEEEIVRKKRAFGPAPWPDYKIRKLEIYKAIARDLRQRRKEESNRCDMEKQSAGERQNIERGAR